MGSETNLILEAVEKMRTDPDPRWQAVAELLTGTPLGYARMLASNPLLAPSNYPDAGRGAAVAAAYLNR